jgi:hypothetical protein
MADLYGRFVQLPGRIRSEQSVPSPDGHADFAETVLILIFHPNGAAPDSVSIRSGAQKMANQC